MVKYRYRSEAADLRAACLGSETHAQSVAVLRGLPRGAASIPAAEKDQARLEGYLWTAMCWPEDYSAHPLGIRCIKPQADGLVVELDGGHVLTHPVMYRLLPRVIEDHGGGHPDLRFFGRPGLRAGWENKAGGVVIALTGTSARVVLRGLTETDWKLAEKRFLTDEAADEVLWRPGTSMHPSELEELKPSRFNFSHYSFRLESTLLRRVAIFHTISNPFNVTAWTSGGWSRCDRHAHCGGPSWSLEAFYSPTLDLAAEALVAAITKTSDLKFARMDTICQGDSLGRSRATYVELGGGPSCLGSLQLRLRTWSHLTVEELRTRLQKHAAFSAEDVERLAPLKNPHGVERFGATAQSGAPAAVSAVAAQSGAVPPAAQSSAW